MRKEIIIRMRPDSGKSHSNALKVAADVTGVESVTLAGRDRDLLLVIGDGVDEGKLTKKLRREVGEAEIVELRTLDARGAAEAVLPSSRSSGKGGDVVVLAQSSPYHWHPTTPGRSPLHGGGHVITYPAASPRAARWPAEHASTPQEFYNPRAPGACYGSYARAPASPMAGRGGVYEGRSYARAPASPMAGRGGVYEGGTYARAPASPMDGRGGVYDGGMYARASASPMAGVGAGVYGDSSYAREVAGRHPANYSPMVERHDYLPMGRSRRGAGRRGHGGDPNCCSIL